MKSDATFVSANVRLRKNCIGSIGDGVRSSQATNAATSSAPTTSGVTMPTLVQPWSLPRTRPQTMPSRPALASPSPGRSSAFVRPVRLLELPPGERREHEPDRHVEPEDPVPRDAAHDRAADERADRDREAADAAPDAEREPAPLGRDRGGEDRQRQRRDDRAADALHARARCRARSPTSRARRTPRRR